MTFSCLRGDCGLPCVSLGEIFSICSLLILSLCVQFSVEDYSTDVELDRLHLEDDNYCRPNVSYVWCLPRDYNQEKHPVTYSHLTNKSLPWNYDFNFVVEEISNVNDKAQTMSISMYFGVSWLDPRLKINDTAPEWTEARTGPKNEVNISPESLRYIWYPELEIYGLERFGRQQVLKEMSGVRIRKNMTIHYELGVRITISCRMMFDDYPLDEHVCQFQVGSYYDTNKTVRCTSSYVYDMVRQRSLQHYISFEDLPEGDKSIVLPSGTYAACGFQIGLKRKKIQYLIQVYLPSCMFVVVSWVSFLIKPEVVPGRMGLLVTLFLVLINIFNSVGERAPISTSLNAVDLYLVVCIFLVFGALMEYAAILLLLKKRRKPRYTIDSGLRKMFNEAGDSVATGHASGTKDDSADELELQAPIVKKPKSVQYAQAQTPPNSAACPYDPLMQEVCDNVDAWAMWLSPPAFILFNLAYWFAYLHSPSEETEQHQNPSFVLQSPEHQ